MCGIAGFYSPKGNIKNEELIKMTNIISHRGPDADGHFYENSFSLGHRRLSIIDLSNYANQPMTSTSGRFVIVFNGEIYNYAELKQEFQLKCRTNSDTEVILEMFEKFGQEAINYFNGMFAFAIFDKQNQKLHIYRDRMGIKPIYYYHKNNDFAFASELKSLLQIKYINSNKSINKAAVSEFLHLGFIPEPHSIYNDIYKLESGGYIEISATSINKGKYWSLEKNVLPSKNLYDNEIQAKEILRDLINQSVKYRLKSDVPFGTFLSGGIDSSLVTAVAQRNISSKLNTFSIGFDNSKHDESKFARSVAEYLGTNHHEFTVSQKDAIKLIPQLQDSFDEPFADSSAIPTMIVSELARKHVTMTLSGDGGDELFMGYGAYQWAHRMSNTTLRNFRKPLSLGMSFLNNKYKRAAYLINYDDIKTIRSHIFSQEQYFSTRKQINRLLRPEYNHKISLQEEHNHSRYFTERESQAFFDLKYYLKDDLLVKVDRASMKHSLEVRVPLLDHNIVEFALNLSPQLKVKNGIPKYLLKEVLYDYIPCSLFDRPKWGFSIPLQEWLKTDLKYLIEEHLSESEIAKYGILDFNEVNSLKSLFLKKNQDFLYNRLWTLIVLQKFLSNQ